MGLESVTPISIDQMLKALAALGQEHVVDPEHRPHGLVAEDVPELLGALMALVETETATLVDPGEEPHRTLAGLQQGWRHTSAERDVHHAVLVNRLHRTAYDVSLLLADVDADAEEGAEPPGIAGASACAMAAHVTPHRATPLPDRAERPRRGGPRRRGRLPRPGPAHRVSAARTDPREQAGTGGVTGLPTRSTQGLEA